MSLQDAARRLLKEGVPYAAIGDLRACLACDKDLDAPLGPKDGPWAYTGHQADCVVKELERLTVGVPA